LIGYQSIVDGNAVTLKTGQELPTNMPKRIGGQLPIAAPEQQKVWCTNQHIEFRLQQKEGLIAIYRDSNGCLLLLCADDIGTKVYIINPTGMKTGSLMELGRSTDQQVCMYVFDL
jgi:hypothetical protein